MHTMVNFPTSPLLKLHAPIWSSTHPRFSNRSHWPPFYSLKVLISRAEVKELSWQAHSRRCISHNQNDLTTLSLVIVISKQALPRCITWTNCLQHQYSDPCWLCLCVAINVTPKCPTWMVQMLRFLHGSNSNANVAISSLGRCSRIVTQEYVAPLPNEIEMHHDRVTIIYIVDSICYSLDMQKAASRDPRDNIITATEILCCVQGLQFVPNVIVI